MNSLSVSTNTSPLIILIRSTTRSFQHCSTTHSPRFSPRITNKQNSSSTLVIRKLIQIQVEKDKAIIANYQTSAWLDNFMSDIKKSQSQLEFAKIVCTPNYKIALHPKLIEVDIPSLVKSFHEATHRVIILNCSAVISVKEGYHLYKANQDNRHSEMIGEKLRRQKLLQFKPLEQIRTALIKLRHDRRNSIYITTRNITDYIDQMFGGLNKIQFFAENGYYYKFTNEEGWQSLCQFNNECVQIALGIMEEYEESIDGSWVEYAETSVTFRMTDSEFHYCDMQLSDLANQLKESLKQFVDVQIIQARKYVTVRPSYLNKGMLMELILKREETLGRKLQWVLCVGRNEEEMFDCLNQVKNNFLCEGGKAISLNVGIVPSYGSHYIKTQQELASLFGQLCLQPERNFNPVKAQLCQQPERNSNSSSLK